MKPRRGYAWAVALVFATGGLCAQVAQSLPTPTAAEEKPIVFSDRDLGFDVKRIDPTRAVYLTLEDSPQIQLQKQQMEERIGGVMISDAPFDTRIVGSSTVQGQREDRNVTNREITTPAGQPTLAPTAPLQNPFVTRNSLYQWELGVVKKFRNGITIEPTTNYQFAGAETPGGFNNRSEFGFNFGVTIPLARGLGTTVNEAPEISARFDWKASWFSLRNVTSQAVLTTMSAYWRCRAAEARYRLLVENEEISARLVGDAESMVKAQQLASAQLSQIQADQESTTAQRIQGEQDLVTARQDLALAIGIGPDGLAIAPLAGAGLPEPGVNPKFPDLQELTNAALNLRDDLRAAKMLEKSRKVLVAASYLNLRPIINLNLNAGYAPFDTRTQATTDRGGQFVGSAGLQMDWPIENNLQRGQLVQDLAVYAQSQIQAADLARNIVSGVIATFAEMRASAALVAHLKAASQLNRDALMAQQELFTLGQAALTDVIIARQRFIGSELDHVGAEERYAISIVQLRYDTGTLVPWDEAGNWISPALWSSIPFVAGPDK